jgi:hypothetical protein
VNLLSATFLDPEMGPTFLRNWDAIAAVLAASARYMVGADNAADPEIVTLIGELSVASQRFRTLWARHDVKQKATGPALFDHPQLGPLDLHYRTLVLPETRQVITVYQAESGSPSEERLRLLSTLAHPSV